MALTLLEASKQVSSDVKRSAIIEMFPRNSALLSVMPFMNISGGGFTYDKEAKLPHVGFRGINDDYTDRSLGVIVPESETLKIIGGEIDVDQATVKMHGAGTRTQQEVLKVKSMIHQITSQIINGDTSQDKKGFDGLRRRIMGRQLFNATGLNTSGAMKLEVLDEAIDSVANPTHIICNKAFRRKLTKAAKNGVGGDIEWTEDSFGRKVQMYNGLPLLLTETDHEDREIIDFNELGPDEAGGCMSAYVVSFGEDKLIGLQNGIMEVEDLGKLQESPKYRTRIEWLVSFAILNGRAVARIRGIKNADFVA